MGNEKHIETMSIGDLDAWLKAHPEISMHMRWSGSTEQWFVTARLVMFDGERPRGASSGVQGTGATLADAMASVMEFCDGTK